jgi:hypothetical protein
MKKFLAAALITVLLSFTHPAQNRDSAPNLPATMVLTGVVYDINGAVIAGGTVMAAVAGENKQYGAVTNDEGSYKIELPLGVYKIEASANLFCPKQVEDFVIVNSTHGKMSLDFVLEVSGTRKRPCKHGTILEGKPKRKTGKKPAIIAE